MDSNKHDWLATLPQQALTAQTAHFNNCNHLCQLENVLLAINDLESAARQPCAYITGVQPALPIQHFPSLFLILEVPLENGGAPDTDLQLGHRYQHSYAHKLKPHKEPEQLAYASKSVGPQYILGMRYIVPGDANRSVQADDRRSSGLCQSTMTFIHVYC